MYLNIDSDSGDKPFYSEQAPKTWPIVSLCRPQRRQPSFWRFFATWLKHLRLGTPSQTNGCSESEDWTGRIVKGSTLSIWTNAGNESSENYLPAFIHTYIYIYIYDRLLYVLFYFNFNATFLHF